MRLKYIFSLESVPYRAETQTDPQTGIHIYTMHYEQEKKMVASRLIADDLYLLELV